MSAQSCIFDPTAISDEWWRTNNIPDELDGQSFDCNFQSSTDGLCDCHKETKEKELSDVSTLIQGQNYIDFGYFSDINFEDFDLSGCVFRCCFFAKADLSEANLNHTDFVNCVLTGANLSTQDLRDVEFTNCDLSRTNLDRSQFERVKFQDCDVSRADLAQSRFTGTSEIINTKLHAADLTDLTVEQNLIEEYQSPYGDSGRKAARDYRAWSQVAMDNGFPDLGRTLYIKHKAAKRRSQCGLNRIQAEISRAVFRYGEGILNITIVSLLVILAATMLYFLAGRGGLSGTQNVCQTSIDCVYISVATFVRLGFAGIDSPSSFVQIITIIESLLGTGLTALLIFVIGRRATR